MYKIHWYENEHYEKECCIYKEKNGQTVLCMETGNYSSISEMEETAHFLCAAMNAKEETDGVKMKHPSEWTKPSDCPLTFQGALQDVDGISEMSREQVLNEVLYANFGSTELLSAIKRMVRKSGLYLFG